MPGVFSFLALRTRFIDDHLEKMINEGIRQVVILGAGLDSRAYRFAQLKSGIKIFEVDHPMTQAEKKKAVIKTIGEIPPNVEFVPIDFDCESLSKLYDYGYDKNLKTLFIWEGVIYYLTEEAVRATLTYIKENAAIGSSIIFDYIYSYALDIHNLNGLSGYQRGSRINGETFIYGIGEDEITHFLEGIGFCQVKDSNVKELIELYLVPRKRVDPVASFYAIAEAYV